MKLTYPRLGGLPLLTVCVYLLGSMLLHGQPRYAKVVATDNFCHTMGGSLFDVAGIRHGGWTNEAPANGSQESHHVSHYTIANSNSWTGFAHIILDDVQLGGQSIGCEAYVALFYVDPNYPAWHGYLPCSDFQPGGQYYSLIQNVTPVVSVWNDYDLLSYHGNLDLTIQGKRLTGTPALEQDFFHAEIGGECFTGTTDGEYYLGAGRQEVSCGFCPIDLVLTRLRGDHSAAWMKRIHYSNPIMSLQMSQVLGLADGGSILLHRVGWGPGTILCMDDNGSFDWAGEYAQVGPGAVTWPIWQHSVQMPATMGDDVYVLGLMYDNTNGHKTSLIKVDESMGTAFALGTSNQKAAVYEWSGYNFTPVKIFRKTSDELIILGQYWEMGGYASSAFVMSTTLSGSINWCKGYDHGVWSAGGDLTFTADGGMWLSGTTLLGAPSNNPTYENQFLMKLDATGVPVANKSHYFMSDAKDIGIRLLAPPTGDHILDGFQYTTVQGGAQVSTYRRVFIKADYDGIGLLCNTVPFEATVVFPSVTRSYEDVSVLKVNGVVVEDLNPDSYDINLGILPASCEDCHCE